MILRTLDPCVAPAGVFFRHPDNQLTDLLHHTGTTYTLSWIRPLGGDQLAVPREDRLRRDDGGDLAQGLPAQQLSFGRQSTALVIGKMQSLAARPGNPGVVQSLICVRGLTASLSPAR